MKTLDPDPAEDCQCYISILSTTNGTEVGMELWEFYNILPGGIINENYPITGTNQLWEPNSPPLGNYLPLPSVPYPPGGVTPPLPGPPSYGTQIFLVKYAETAQGDFHDFTVNTEVNCFLVHNDGSEELSTTTYHQFNINEGLFDSALDGWLFSVHLSCYTIPDKNR